MPSNPDADFIAVQAAPSGEYSLDVLRVQRRGSGVESIAGSLDAAKRLSERIAHTIEAQQKAEQWLRDEPRRLPPVTLQHQHDVDDDADTPVGGVPATTR